MRNLIATGGVILVALATSGGALAQGEALAPITPEQCRFIESYVGTATAGLHRQVEAANQLADSLNVSAVTGQFGLDTMAISGQFGLMTLDEFRRAHGWSVSELAKKLGLHDARSAQRYLSGARMPRPDVMRRIIDVTEGKVGPADFYALPPTSGAGGSQPEAA